jgi:hypothetical protein
MASPERLGSARFQPAAFGILPNAYRITETECLPQDAGAPQKKGRESFTRQSNKKPVEIDGLLLSNLTKTLRPCDGAADKRMRRERKIHQATPGQKAPEQSPSY